MTDDAPRVPKRGPMTSDAPDYDGLYRDALQGDFYGADYYRPPASDIDSAIIYDDNEDKRATAAFVALNFGPKRVLEVGCAMGLFVKALRGQGIEAEGVDFSRWCVDHAHPAVRAWVRWGDVLSLPRAGRILTTSSWPSIFSSICRRTASRPRSATWPRRCGRAASFHGHSGLWAERLRPELYPLQFEEWRRDAERGRPFRNIPARRQRPSPSRPSHPRRDPLVGARHSGGPGLRGWARWNGFFTSASTPRSNSRAGRSLCSPGPGGGAGRRRRKRCSNGSRRCPGLRSDFMNGNVGERPLDAMDVPESLGPVFDVARPVRAPAAGHLQSSGIGDNPVRSRSVSRRRGRRRRIPRP